MLEIELKLPLHEATNLQNFFESVLIRSLKTQFQSLHTIYFDSHDALLRQREMALRIRHHHQTYTQTIKQRPKQSEQALQKYMEWESVVASFTPDLTAIVNKQLRCELINELHDKSLQPIFSTEFTRQTWDYPCMDGCLIEIALDQGFIVCQQAKSLIFEIELELKQGENENLLYELAALIGQYVDVLPDKASKAKRGYALAATCGVINL